MNSTEKIKNYKINKSNRYFKIRANIKGSKLIHVSGFHSDYAEYYIRIETDYAKWTLKKRYEDFSRLNSKLTVIIPELKKIFPPRRIFKSMDDIIGERIKLFNKYLGYLCSEINIFLIDQIINFISLPKEIILLYIKKYSMLKIDEDNVVLLSLKMAYKRMNELELKLSRNERRESNNDIISELENENNYYNSLLKYEKKRQISFNWDEPIEQTPNLLVIIDFLQNLSEKSENKTEIIRTFENFLKKDTKWVKLSPKEIMLLYIGKDLKEEELEENKEYLNRSVNVTKKRKKISSDYKYHSSFELIDPDDDITNNAKEDYYLKKESKINGLFYIIGNYNKNIILSFGILELLNKLIDTEYNPDSEIYINVFKSCDIKDYKMLNLNTIIKMNVGGDKTNLKALKLLKLIFSDKSRGQFKIILMEDNTVYKQYINYLNKFIE